ncbi:hypothetical protein HYR99_24520 [Candidatus Poribacteria bacterium]|nr:hypothetical protein [Candidatus Poribacteria bacterium]
MTTLTLELTDERAFTWPSHCRQILGRVDELFGGSNRSPRFYLGKTR